MFSILAPLQGKGNCHMRTAWKQYFLLVLFAPKRFGYKDALLQSQMSSFLCQNFADKMVSAFYSMQLYMKYFTWAHQRLAGNYFSISPGAIIGDGDRN